MAKKKSSSGNTAAKAGAGASLIGALTWLTGDLSWENALDWGKSLGLAIGLALVIRWTLGEPYRIPSGSMLPTFKVGDRIFVNKFVYGWRWPLNDFRIPFTKIRLDYASKRIWKGRDPERFDIVVFKAVEKDTFQDVLVKRVVGLPGERVHIYDGKVHIDGKPLELPASMPKVEYTQFAEYGVRPGDRFRLVPEGHYFLLGDNSSSSRDGRYWGFVPNEHLLGRVSCIWWPVSRWRDFTGFSRTWWWRSLVGLLGLLFFARLFLGRSWRIQSSDADAAVQEGDHVYVGRWPFGLTVPFTTQRIVRGRNPRRGELAAYRAPGAEDKMVLLGRVAALPGEQVRLDEGALLVDDEPVQDPPSLAGRTFPDKGAPGPYGRGKRKQQTLVPPGHFFILSDNPQDTPDSRSLGWVPYDNLVGIVTTVWWPPKRWRRVRP